jgi:hypothetical protein
MLGSADISNVKKILSGFEPKMIPNFERVAFSPSKRLGVFAGQIAKNWIMEEMLPELKAIPMVTRVCFCYLF